MEIQNEKIKSLLHDFIALQKEILFNKSRIIDNKNSLKEFAVNICELIDFKELDTETFNCLINKDVESWSNKHKVDYSICNEDRYYRIEFKGSKIPFLKRTVGIYSEIWGRITILNNSDTGHYGYRVYFERDRLKKEYGDQNIIDKVRIYEFKDDKPKKAYNIKLDRNLVAKHIYKTQEVI